ncbi:helix-turn-helix domain-containing protein [Pantoea sp. 18069]|uniref:helix-turn-helix domain-containing protein n=1 Tax=Pantoea sp. 18069 TaxID=2681415 RepID=UPI0034D433C8
MLNAHDVAPLLGCQPSTVEAAWRTGKLPGVRIGQHWQVPESALREGLHLLALCNMQPVDVPAAVPKLPPPMPAARAQETRGRQRREPPALPPLPPALQKS